MHPHCSLAVGTSGLQLPLAEVRNRVDDNPRDASFKVHTLMHDKTHQSSRDDRVLNPHILRSPIAFEPCSAWRGRCGSQRTAATSRMVIEHSRVLCRCRSQLIEKNQRQERKWSTDDRGKNESACVQPDYVLFSSVVRESRRRLGLASENGDGEIGRAHV